MTPAEPPDEWMDTTWRRALSVTWWLGAVGALVPAIVVIALVSGQEWVATGAVVPSVAAVGLGFLADRRREDEQLALTDPGPVEGRGAMLLQCYYRITAAPGAAVWATFAVLATTVERWQDIHDELRVCAVVLAVIAGLTPWLEAAQLARAQAQHFADRYGKAATRET